MLLRLDLQPQPAELVQQPPLRTHHLAIGGEVTPTGRLRQRPHIPRLAIRALVQRLDRAHAGHGQRLELREIALEPGLR